MRAPRARAPCRQSVVDGARICWKKSTPTLYNSATDVARSMSSVNAILDRHRIHVDDVCSISSSSTLLDMEKLKRLRDRIDKSHQHIDRYTKTATTAAGAAAGGVDAWVHHTTCQVVADMPTTRTEEWLPLRLGDRISYAIFTHIIYHEMMYVGGGCIVHGIRDAPFFPVMVQHLSEMRWGTVAVTGLVVMPRKFPHLQMVSEPPLSGDQVHMRLQRAKSTLGIYRYSALEFNCQHVCQHIVSGGNAPNSRSNDQIVKTLMPLVFLIFVVLGMIMTRLWRRWAAAGGGGGGGSSKKQLSVVK